MPIGEPFTSPIVGEVQIVARDVDSQLVVTGNEYAVFSSALSELSCNVCIHGNNSVVSDLYKLVGKIL